MSLGHCLTDERAPAGRPFSFCRGVGQPPRRPPFQRNRSHASPVRGGAIRPSILSLYPGHVRRTSTRGPRASQIASPDELPSPNRSRETGAAHRRSAGWRCELRAFRFIPATSEGPRHVAPKPAKSPARGAGRRCAAASPWLRAGASRTGVRYSTPHRPHTREPYSSASPARIGQSGRWSPWQASTRRPSVSCISRSCAIFSSIATRCSDASALTSALSRVSSS